MLAQLLREISASHGELRADQLSFRGSVPTSGSVTYTKQTATCRADYDYFFTEVRAGLTTAGLTGNSTTADAYFQDIDELRFNVKVDGTGENIFTDDIEMQTMISPVDGRPLPMTFSPSGYAIAGGKKLTFTVTRRATTIDVARTIAVALVAILVPVGFAEKAARAAAAKMARV